jgi:4-hydroxybenzoate polyprenyltransferase
MKIPGFIRSNEWWEYKLTLFLFVGLFVILDLGSSNPISSIFHLSILLMAIIVGAVFVSLINDFTDLEDDKKAGKSNRLAGFSISKSIFFILISISVGVLFIWYLWSYSRTIFFYLGAWISFSLYSFPPIRLKSRGIFGVFADAFGAHVFPTLFIFSGMFEFLNKEPEFSAFLLLGGWAFSYGLRGILWHQYFDLPNDRISGVQTLASHLGVNRIKSLEKIILFFELISFILLITLAHQTFLLVLLVMYLIYSGLISRVIQITQVLILVPEKGSWTFFMASFYQTVVPLSLMFFLSVESPVFLILFPVYLLFFTKDLRMNYGLIKSLVYRLKKS